MILRMIIGVIWCDIRGDIIDVMLKEIKVKYRYDRSGDIDINININTSNINIVGIVLILTIITSMRITTISL